MPRIIEGEANEAKRSWRRDGGDQGSREKEREIESDPCLTVETRIDHRRYTCG